MLKRVKPNRLPLDEVKAFSESTRIPLRLFDSRGAILWESKFFKLKRNVCKTIQSDGFPTRSFLRAHREAVRESLRWGEAIISRCCYFLMQIVAPVMKKRKLAGMLVASPLLMIDPSELQPEELVSLQENVLRRDGALDKALLSVPIVKDEEVRKAAHRLFKLAEHLSDPDLSHLQKVREAQALQGKIADQIHRLKDLDREFSPNSLSKLFYEKEKEIVSKIRLGDKRGAEEILHQLLAIVLIQYLENFELLKISILELLIILSRAAVEAGAKIEDMLGMRSGFITELSRIRDQETLCLWIVNALEGLMKGIYETRHAQNYQRLRKALDFIEAHYSDPLKVEQIAREVCLSSSRLSHIIKKEFGITLGEYISRVRIEKAKILLGEPEIPLSRIALEVGYPDQSYFTKVFKKIEHCTPKVYRRNVIHWVPSN